MTTGEMWLVCKCGHDDRAELGDYVTKVCERCGRMGCWVEYSFDPDAARRQAELADLKSLFGPGP